MQVSTNAGVVCLLLNISSMFYLRGGLFRAVNNTTAYHSVNSGMFVCLFVDLLSLFGYCLRRRVREGMEAGRNAAASAPSPIHVSVLSYCGWVRYLIRLPH